VSGPPLRGGTVGSFFPRPAKNRQEGGPEEGLSVLGRRFPVGSFGDSKNMFFGCGGERFRVGGDGMPGPHMGQKNNTGKMKNVRGLQLGFSFPGGLLGGCVTLVATLLNGRDTDTSGTSPVYGH